MKILEFEIDKYGPLRNSGKKIPGGFALFYGRNENGKTLTIDALIKLLLGGRVKDFKQADRISEDPAGYLKLEFENDDIRRMPDDGDLAQITKTMDISLTSFDLRNIFIIRNSDLSISDEAKFFTGITDKLVGLRTGDITKIRRNLLEIGRMTPALGFRDDEKSVKLKTRLVKAKDLIQRMERVKDRLVSGNLDKLEIDLAAKERQVKILNDRIQQYEDAGNRSLYEKSAELLKNLERCILQIGNMGIFREDDAEMWNDSERELGRLKIEINNLKNWEKESESARNALKARNNDIKTGIDLYERKKNIIDNERFRLKNIQGTEYEIVTDAALGRFILRLSIISSIFVIPVVISWIFHNSAYLLIAGIILFFITFGLWIFESVLFIKRKKFSRIFGEIKRNLSECGLDADSVEQGLSSIGKFNEQYEKKLSDLRSAESELLAVERQIDEVKERITGCMNNSDKLEKSIISLKTSTGQNSLDDYRKLLSVKKNLEKERDSISDNLRGMLGVQNSSMGETLGIIKKRISELSIYKDKAPDLDFDQRAYEDIKEKVRANNSELESMNELNEKIRNEMAGLEAASNEILIDYNETLFCRTAGDLNEIHSRLSSFLKENENIKRAVEGAFEILREIESEEKARVHELFQNNSRDSVPVLFEKITNGLYKDVIFDPDNESVKVIHSNGAMLNADQLSGGAYDQLYLAVRLALGSRLLKNEKGFFILDDPFVKSDTERIGKQMDILKKISESGWQILYFTCKDEIKDILLNDIKQNKINYFEMKL